MPTEKYPVTKRKKIRLKTADFPLPRSLTTQFIHDLRTVLSNDDTVEALHLDSMFLSKFTELDADSASIRRSRAIEKWLSTEITNDLTNRRLLQFGESSGVDVIPGIPAKRFLDKVAEIIARVLPYEPSLDVANGGFSGGASTSKNRVQGHPALKFLDKADVTRPALPVFQRMIAGTRWADHLDGDVRMDPNIVKGNVLFTVPKNSDIDRVACKEPDLNMFLQKGLGNQIRACLRRVGIDLNDQSINQELARKGAITGQLMTLDLSSASDSVTYELVRRVLPPNWFFYLDLFRSHQTEIDGDIHVNEMFSSMGNGFTFELESLLFYSITRATAYFCGVRGQLSVYGDDIIAPSELGQDLVSALAFCGFTTNESKSFMTGPFRESCGKHWHGSCDVTPFFIRKPFRTISDLILTLNQLSSWASRIIGVMDPRYEAIHLKYREYIPVSLWGGGDLTSRSSLVTGHSARKELVWPQELIPHYHNGGLLYWLFTSLNRHGFIEERLTVDGSRTPAFARVRNRRAVNGNDLPVLLSQYGTS